MRKIICLTAAIAICAATQASAKEAAKAPFEIKKTSWTYTDKNGTNVRESIDADGKFIANSTAGKHLDHGTSLMKDGKACFTSAMTKEGEVCWTAPGDELAIGHSFVTTSDKGEKLTVTRVDYEPLSMPK